MLFNDSLFYTRTESSIIFPQWSITHNFIVVVQPTNSKPDLLRMDDPIVTKKCGHAQNTSKNALGM
jgi:hypothetical protein